MTAGGPFITGLLVRKGLDSISLKRRRLECTQPAVHDTGVRLTGSRLLY